MSVSGQASIETMNWDLCCLCQTNKPGEALRRFTEQGQVSNLKAFTAINANDLPCRVSVTQLNDGSGIAAT